MVTNKQNFKSGRKVSLEDLARHVGLAVGTVSRALNDNERVNKKTRERVKAAAEELGYRPNPLARGLRMGRSGLVGISFFMNSPSRNVVVSSQLYFLHQHLQAAGKRSLVEFSGWEYEEKARAIEHFLSMRAEGIIHLGTFPSKMLEVFLELRQQGVPLICINPFREYLPYSVSLDRTRAYEKMMDYLLDLGHRKFAVLGFTNFYKDHIPSVHPRITGIKKSLKRRGLDFKKCVTVCFDPPEKLESSPDYGYRLAEKFSKKLKKVTACLASNDDVALGAIQLLKSQGIRVPDDLSIVGFDDSTPYSDPPLTTVSQEIERITQVAVDMLLKASKNQQEDLPPVMIDPTIIIRDSTAKV